MNARDETIEIGRKERKVKGRKYAMLKANHQTENILR